MEPKRIERNFKNMYRLKPLKNQKLYTALIIMLRNTITSKTAIGPINTSNSETVAVLKPQKGLAAANTKIK